MGRSARSRQVRISKSRQVVDKKGFLVKNHLWNGNYIGPAGWSYADWKGIVYPERGAVDELGLLCSLFDAIEVNGSSTALPPNP